MPEGSFVRRTIQSLRQRFLGQEVTVYPSYGYQDTRAPGTWTVPMRAWVHDNRDTPFVQAAVERWAARHFSEELGRPLDKAEVQRLESILDSFIADDKSGESVTFQFVNDPERQVFAFSQATSHNGIIEENVQIPAETVERLRTAQELADPWLPVEAATTDGNGGGVGHIRFLKPSGVSIVSDIDDTIKVTEVPAGKQAILRNTFLKQFRAAPGMLDRYRGLIEEAGADRDVCFHYVSGSPWQMYSPLSEFLISEAGFPRGTFHMKNLRKNLLEPGAFESIRAFLLSGDLATLDQKVRQITHLIMHQPDREFILIGDSGEKDPEVYRAIQRLFPGQIRRILIRDILGKRLEGMERIADDEIAVFLDTSELEAEMLRMVAAARMNSEDSQKL
jgi:hypothetical protein